jgi:hypothetical protein
MKKMFYKFLVSLRLDRSRIAGDSNVEGHEPCLEEVDFESRCVELERRLRAAVPLRRMPAELHARIMRQVRAVERSRRQDLRFSWWAASALFVAALLLSEQWHPRTQHTSSQASPGSLGGLSVAYEAATRLPMQSQKAFVAPLANELDSLNADLRGAAGMLLASLPSAAGTSISMQP